MAVADDQQELQRLIDAAVAAKVEELRAEVESQVEQQQEHLAMAEMSKAANEGAVIRQDPGTGYEFALILLEKIDFNPLSKRTKEDLDPESIGIRNLAKDIKARGGLHRPLLVYRKGDRYVLVKGARRLVALRVLGEETNHAYILPAKPPTNLEETWVNGY